MIIAPGLTRAVRTGKCMKSFVDGLGAEHDGDGMHSSRKKCIYCLSNSRSNLTWRRESEEEHTKLPLEIRIALVIANYQRIPLPSPALHSLTRQ